MKNKKQKIDYLREMREHREYENKKDKGAYNWQHQLERFLMARNIKNKQPTYLTHLSRLGKIVDTSSGGGAAGGAGEAGGTASPERGGHHPTAKRKTDKEGKSDPAALAASR